MQHNITVQRLVVGSLAAAIFAGGLLGDQVVTAQQSPVAPPPAAFLPVIGINIGEEAAPQPTPPTTPDRQEGQQPAIAQEVMRLVNAERAKAGCKPIAEQQQLVGAAELHSQNQAKGDYYSHWEPGTRKSSGERARDQGYTGRGVSENLMVGTEQASVIVQAWMNSSGHRTTMLDCAAVEGGVGVYYQPQDQGNVQAVDFFTGKKVPFGPDGYSTDPLDGIKTRGPYYYYTTLVVAEGTSTSSSEDLYISTASPLVTPMP